MCCASEDGELFLHRFEKFERVWKLERLENFPNAKITGICWRPDGRALAISYKSDQGAFFKLITEEGPSDLRDEISLPDEVVDMAWQGTNHHQEKEEDIFPKLPDIEKFNIYETLDYVFEANLSFLVLTLDNNKVLSYLYGAVPFIKWDGNNVCSEDEKLVTARFTDDLNQIFVISKCQNQYKCHKIDTSQEYSIESNLKSIFEYSQNTLLTQRLVLLSILLSFKTTTNSTVQMRGLDE